MTSYAYRPDTTDLLAVWETGTSATVAPVTQVADPELGSHLAAALTSLSSVIWRTYTHPATSAGNPDEANTAAWRRQHAAEALDRITEVLTNPHLPSGGGMIVSYVPTEEAAHCVGRALHAIADPKVHQAVAAEAAHEVDAVRRADLGDLTGRAAQAVTLSRQEVSPTQVQAAWDLLAASPLHAETDLARTLDPTAAAVAAAAWLRGAAQLAVGPTGVRWTQVVARADDIEALPVETPTAVLELLEEGFSPTDTVDQLVRNALAVAEGRMPENVTDLVDEVEEAIDRAERYGGELGLYLPRLTPLDPRRPAPDLLEDLLSGIWGCFLWWREQHWDEVLSDTGDSDDEEDADEEADDAAMATLTALFTERLRAAMATVDRHLL